MEDKKYLKVIFAVVGMAVVLVALSQLGLLKKKGGEKGDEKTWRAEQEQSVAGLIRAGDITKCDDISYKAADGIAYKTVCINNIALKKALENGDYEWCKKLDDKLFSIADCNRQVVFAKLQKENNLSVCDSAPSPELKDQCIMGYWNQKAVSANDEVICKNITDAQASGACKDNVLIEQLIKKPSSVQCTQFSEGLKNDCEQFKLAKTATSTNRFASCRTILHPQLQFACER